jgi:two-component SAPR family response regulator
MTKSTGGVTLYDLMAEDFNVWLEKDKKYGYNLHLESFDSKCMEVVEDNICDDAIDGFAHVCRRFLHLYDKINGRAVA